MRILYSVILLVLLATVIGCGERTAFTPTPFAPLGATGTVEGYVYANAAGLEAQGDARTDAQPIAGVTVSVSGRSTVTDVTGEDGHFHLDGVPCGAQRLFLSRDGYTRTAVALTVTEGLNTINPTDAQTPAPYQWTVLVYMAADNSLDTVGLDDINEMEEVGSTQDVKILVQYDRAASGAWTDTRRFVVSKDADPYTIHPVNMTSIGEVDMGNPASLHDFVLWGQLTAPAEHYLLVLWDHGSGWDIDGDRPALRSIATDVTNNNDAIRIVELSGALAGTQPIDIIACDACEMAMLEVAYEVRNTADYFVASEELEPDQGYMYNRMFGKLVSAEGLAMTPAQYAAFMANDTAVQWSSVAYATCSAIDLGQMTTVASALNTLAACLRVIGSSYPDAVKNSRDQGELFDISSVEVRADLGRYADLIGTNVFDTETSAAAQALRAAITHAVIANAHTSYHPYATGISIYLPSPSEYASDAAAYPLLALAKETVWNEWLASQPK